MDDSSTSNVVSNRLSWKKFDLIRKNLALESHFQTPKRKRVQCSASDIPTPKRKHSSPLNPTKTEDDLLEKARCWNDDEVINWSKLAREYGITRPNGGQSIKEFLKGHQIPAAMHKQRAQRCQRRKRKTLPGGVPFPMARPTSFHKKKLSAQVQAGEIVQGDNIVPVSVSGFSVDKSAKIVTQTSSLVYAKQIPLLDIRRKLLNKHKSLGLICKPNNTSSDSSLSRHLKVWHDHSSIGGHGHILVLVSVIYDSSFFLTQSEASELGMNIDI